jgi:hypothetical protein
VQTLEFRVEVLGAPRLAGPPPGDQVAGSDANKRDYYVYQAEVTAWVNRTAGTLSVPPGGGGARKKLRAEILVGPVEH